MIYLMIFALILMMVDDGIIGIQFGQDQVHGKKAKESRTDPWG
jgi:hypothetical protein